MLSFFKILSVSSLAELASASTKSNEICPGAPLVTRRKHFTKHFTPGPVSKFLTVHKPDHPLVSNMLRIGMPVRSASLARDGLDVNSPLYPCGVTHHKDQRNKPQTAPHGYKRSKTARQVAMAGLPVPSKRPFKPDAVPKCFSSEEKNDLDKRAKAAKSSPLTLPGIEKRSRNSGKSGP